VLVAVAGNCAPVTGAVAGNYAPVTVKNSSGQLRERRITNTQKQPGSEQVKYIAINKEEELRVQQVSDNPNPQNGQTQ
jgi:hypothetical protein